MTATMEDTLYTQLATMLDFPREELSGVAQRCLDTLAGQPEYPKEVTESISNFKDALADLSLDDLQGIYSYTFEIASGEYTLDLGYHLFDGFKRANNLLALKATYRKYDYPIDETSGGELPDHLPIVLRFLSFLKDEDLKREMCEVFLIKALEGLAKNFEKKQDVPYYHAVKAVLMVIDADVKNAGLAEDDKGDKA